MRIPTASTFAAPVLAAGVTLGLFLFMASLIRLSEGPATPFGPKVSVDEHLALPAKTEPKPPERTHKKEEMKESIRPSPIARIELPTETGPGELIVPDGPGIPGTGDQMTPRWTGPDEPAAGEPSVVAGRDSLMPLLRREPVYPSEAARAGVQGWVELEFSVLPDGRIAEIRVLAAKPRQVFEKAAQRALAGWKYQAEPGGETRRGNRVRLDFRLENAD